MKKDWKGILKKSQSITSYTRSQKRRGWYTFKKKHNGVERTCERNMWTMRAVQIQISASSRFESNKHYHLQKKHPKYTDESEKKKSTSELPSECCFTIVCFLISIGPTFRPTAKAASSNHPYFRGKLAVSFRADHLLDSSNIERYKFGALKICVKVWSNVDW